MYNLNDEINKRMQQKSWSEEMARKVISEKSRRTKRKLTLTGSLFIVFFLSFVVGINASRIRSEEASWDNYIMSAVTESTNTEIPQDVVEFISYSFNGQ
jgi:hypothetical protein